MDSLFLPGWGAPAALYAPLLPSGWTALEPPSFAASGGALAAYRDWLGDELAWRGRSVLGGHSMGGAIALLLAADEPALIERLVLISPAGLPLLKPIHRSAADFGRQALRGVYPLRAVVRGTAALARAPRAARRLAHEVRTLDLRRECARVRAARVPVRVIGCSTDTLVRSESAKRLAGALGAEYVELDAAGGHMWMLTDSRPFVTALAG